MSIENIYRVMVNIKLTTCQQDFSVNWLGRSQSYYSAITAMGRRPSLQALSYLALRVDRLAADTKGLCSYPTCPSLHALHGNLLRMRDSVWSMMAEQTCRQLIKPTCDTAQAQLTHPAPQQSHC